MANPIVLSSSQKYWQLHLERPQQLAYTWNALGLVFWTSRAVVVLTYKYCLLIVFGADKMAGIVVQKLKNLNPNESHFFHGFKALDQYDICFLSTGELKLVKEKLLTDIRGMATAEQRIALCQRIVQLFHPVIALANEEYKRDAIADISNTLYDELNSIEEERALIHEARAPIFEGEDDIPFLSLILQQKEGDPLWDDELIRICRYQTRMNRLEHIHPPALMMKTRLRSQKIT